MQRPRVYLDTQQWGYLAAPPDRPDLGIDPTRFERAARSRAFQIVASLDLLQEAIAAINGGRDLVDGMIRPMLRHAGPRLLQPLERRHPREVSHGGLLPERTRYIAAYERDEFPTLLDSDEELREITRVVEEQKAAFKSEQEQLRVIVSEELIAAGVPIKPRLLREWFDTHDRLEWAQSVVERGEQLGLYTTSGGETWNCRRVPSMYTFLCYQQARVVQTLGEGRNIKKSDLADAHHAAAGPYCDVLVTDDQAFRLALDFLPCRTFQPMTSAEFSATHLNP